jgi:putative tryptophan/tyrosine transport system substrate-binding protein
MGVRRRDLLIGSLAVSTLGRAWAQQRDNAQPPGRIRRVAILEPASEKDDLAQQYVAAFEETLQQQGWSDGRDIRFDVCWGETDSARIRQCADELGRSAPDVALTIGSLAANALRHANPELPIIFTFVSDPVAQGLVKSIARPDTNCTGFIIVDPAVRGKWLELLKTVAPSVLNVGVLYSPETLPPAVVQSYLAAIKSVAQPLGVNVKLLSLSQADDIERLLRAFATEQSDEGIIVLPSPVVVDKRKPLIATLRQLRLPAIYPWRYFVESGGLLSYGPDSLDYLRQAAVYADHILKGAKPAELPIQAPNRYELVVNRSTAKALGLALTSSFLARADEVIE